MKVFMDYTDEELVSLFQSGDSQAFEALVTRNLPSVYAFCFRMTLSKDEAEDISQEVFLKAWTKIAQFEKTLSFKAWLIGIARNTSIDFLRKKKPYVFSQYETHNDTNTLTDSLTDSLPLADEIFESKEQQETLIQMLSEIPIEMKTILILKHQSNMTFEEIAVIQKKPMNTVKSQYRRALILLKEKWHMHQNAI